VVLTRGKAGEESPARVARDVSTHRSPQGSDDEARSKSGRSIGRHRAREQSCGFGAKGHCRALLQRHPESSVRTAPRPALRRRSGLG
jgi:hypothetical protein